MALGPLTTEILNVLSTAGRPLTVGQVRDVLNRDRAEPLAYTTVMTVLGRLNGRYTVRRERAGRGYAYSAEAADPAQCAVLQVIQQHGAAAAMHFLNHAVSDPALRERLLRLLAEEEHEPAAGPVSRLAVRPDSTT